MEKIRLTNKEGTITSVRLQPGDAEIIDYLKDEGFNISALFRKAIRDKYKQCKQMDTN